MSVPLLRREELLSVERLAEVLDNAESRSVAVIELKAQAKQNNLPIREFSGLLKEAETPKLPAVDAGTEKFPEEITKKIKTTGDYLVGYKGIFLVLGNSSVVEVCPHPIFPIAVLKDIDTGEEKVQIAYYKKGSGWNYGVLVERTQLASTRGVVGLAKYGIMANDENARYLVKYFCDIEMANIETLPLTKSCGYLGKTADGWIPYSKNVVYNKTDADCDRRFSLYTEKGDFKIWKEWQLKVCEHTIPKICIATAYASMLTELFGLNPFSVHLWGETGKGKSVAVLASASVYGYPDIKDGIVYTGNSTSNGLEPRLAFVRNFTFYLDELSMKTADQIDKMIYLVMQGQGKARMTQGARAQNTYYWYLCTLSNAEMPITNDYSKGGIYNRIIQISPTGSVFGEMNMPEIASIFKANYGFGAPRFVELLENPDIVREMCEMQKNYYDALKPTTEDKQANSGSILLTAFNTASRYIYGTETRLTVEEIKQFLFSSDEISQVMRIYDKFLLWSQANYKYFDDSELGATQQKWGKIADEHINILPYRLEEFCQKVQIDLKQFVGGLKDRDLLKCGHGRNTNTFRIVDEPVRCYSIKITSTGKTSTQKSFLDDLKEVEDDGTIPF